MDDFFAGIEQVEMNLESGSIKFPIFYRDARMFNVLLPVNAIKLRRMLPDVRFTPAQVVPGVGAVAITAFEYHDTDIRPYNELSVGILLNSPYYPPVPGYNMLRQYFAGMFSVFIHRLPVTTEIALRGGIDFYNYPKFIAGIDFSDTPDSVSCELSRDGERILTVAGPRVPTRNIGEMKLLCNLYHNRQPQSAEFKMNVVQGRIDWMPSGVSWQFNPASEIGKELSSIVLGTRALMYFYMPNIQCILYGPEHIPIPLMRRVTLSEGFLPDVLAARPAQKPAVKKKAAKKPAAKKKPAGNDSAG